MLILGIETSCDETAAAVVEKRGNRVQIISNVVASSAKLQAKYGGVIPEQAAREQIRSIIPVVEEALIQAYLTRHPRSNRGSINNNKLLDSRLRGNDMVKNVDAIAVTYGPGLIGSLLVGVETAKTLATVWNKPLIPVNHLIGHFYANWINYVESSKYNVVREEKRKTHTTNYILHTTPSFPCLGLLVSGGHTDLVIFTSHGKYKYLGGTRDDAAGECFDKCARLLGLPYPGGPEISKLAKKGSSKAFDLPRPMIDSDDFDFSFSGLKTAVANLIKNWPVILERSDRIFTKKRSYQPLRGFQDDKRRADLAASIEAAIIDVLVEKTIRAAKKYKIEQIMIAGGVAANQKLSSNLQRLITHNSLPITLHIPPPYLCTDNAAMIASAAFFLPRHPAGVKPTKNPLSLQADPNLALTH